MTICKCILVPCRTLSVPFLVHLFQLVFFTMFALLSPFTFFLSIFFLFLFFFLLFHLASLADSAQRSASRGGFFLWARLIAGSISSSVWCYYIFARLLCETTGSILILLCFSKLPFIRPLWLSCLGQVCATFLPGRKGSIRSTGMVPLPYLCRRTIKKWTHFLPGAGKRATIKRSWRLCSLRRTVARSCRASSPLIRCRCRKTLVFSVFCPFVCIGLANSASSCAFWSAKG